jgi:hypothetical protein
VPGAFPTGTNHYADAGHPADALVEGEYEELYAGIMQQIPARQTALSDADANPSEVARQITRVVGLPKGQRPFRVHIDPMQDGAEEVFDLGDRIRTEFYQRIGLDDLSPPGPADVRRTGQHATDRPLGPVREPYPRHQGAPSVERQRLGQDWRSGAACTKAPRTA